MKEKESSKTYQIFRLTRARTFKRGANANQAADRPVVHRAVCFCRCTFLFHGQSEKGGDAFELRMPTTHDMFLHYDQMRSF